MSCRYLRLMCFSWDVTDRFFVWFSKKEIFLPIRNKDRYSVSFLLYFSLFLCEYNVVPGVGDLSKITRLLRRLGTCNVFSKHTFSLYFRLWLWSSLFPWPLVWLIRFMLSGFEISSNVVLSWHKCEVQPLLRHALSLGLFPTEYETVLVIEIKKATSLLTATFCVLWPSYFSHVCRQSMALCSIQRHL